MKFFVFLKERQGSFLIETMVALTLVTVGLLGLVSLVTRSLVLNQNVRDRFIAASLAAEGIEVVKNLIDTNYARRARGVQVLWDDGIDDGYYRLSYDCPILNEGTRRCASISDLTESLENVIQQPLPFFLDSRGIYNYETGDWTVFQRLIRVDNFSVSNSPAESKIQVNAYVRWDTRGAKNMINVEDHFYNRRQ